MGKGSKFDNKNINNDTNGNRGLGMDNGGCKIGIGTINGNGEQKIPRPKYQTYAVINGVAISISSHTSTEVPNKSGRDLWHVPGCPNTSTEVLNLGNK